MPLAFPDESGHRPEDAEPAATRPPERDRARARTREEESAPEPTQADAEADTREGEIVPFPGGGQLAERPPSAVATAAQEWWAEAARSAARAVDGSIWRARPPAIRDSVVRLKRAEWAGGITALRWAGWIYGAPAQLIRAVLMVVIWLLDHPSRLLVAGGVVIAALFLH